MTDPVDVLIIGAGASGAAVAWSLAETRMHILCLEQGGWMKPTDYPSNGRDWEAPAVRRLRHLAQPPRPAGGLPGQRRDSPIKVLNFNAVGGSTIIYTGHFPRLHPSDFRVRTLDGVADDWPVDYDTLEPFFAENDRMVGVSGLAGDPGFPPRAPADAAAAARHGPARPSRRAMNRLGWHWWPSDTALATTEYEGRAPCINLGHCTHGCAQGAKASPDITYWPAALRAGVELRPQLPGARDHHRCRGHGDRRRSTTTPRAPSASSRRMSSSSPATASARRASCSTPPPADSPMAWPIPPAWSAGT